MAKKVAPADADFRPVPIFKDANLSARQFETHVRNINNMMASTNEDQRRKGNDWYYAAHQLARHFGGGDPERGAGIIAALSPQTGWGVNLNQARQLAEHPGFSRRELKELAIPKKKGGDRSFLAGTPLAMHPGDTILNAYRISHQGESPSEVLDPRKKTGQFFQNIYDPENPEPVTIDQHAHDLAIGRKMGSGVGRGLDAVSRYGSFARAYHAARTDWGVMAHQLQATTWAGWRDQHPSRVPDQSFDVSRIAGDQYRHLNVKTNRAEWEG